jgi:hypothetical protein
VPAFSVEELASYTPEMKAAGFLEALLLIFQSTLNHIPEDNNL